MTRKGAGGQAGAVICLLARAARRALHPAVLAAAALALVSPAALRDSSTSPAVVATRARLYHVPVAVGDLDAASRQFERLGFVLKPGRAHGDGIVNRHAKFPDGTEIELITSTARPRSDSARFYRRFVRQGDGPAFLALYLPDYRPVTGWLEKLRMGFRAAPDYLTVEGDGPLSYFFFAPLGAGTRLNHSPTDRPAHFRHPNGSRRLAAVWLAADDFSAERGLFARLGAAARPVTAHVPGTVRAEAIALASGRVMLLPGRFQRVRERRIVGLTVAVDDLARTGALLAARGVPVTRGPGGGSLFVPPERAAGVWIEFREARPDHSY